ncbi:MAG TPA: dUTP diphosphatase [Candidatus Nanoarchaeia archaeon]|nr:dUTP diphosphatase [Candidatus Nanoarchaeia archaeon]
MKKEVNKNKKQNNKLCLEVQKLSDDVITPEYILESDVGLDLRANEDVSLMPLEQKEVKTGLIVKIPEGHVGLIRDRAGIVSQMNVHIVAGTFDSDYRGEVSIILSNAGDEEVEIEKGMRIAQMIIIPVTKVEVKVVKSLSKTERGSKGFGSTGLKEVEE